MSHISEITNNPLNIRWSVRNKWFGQTGAYKDFVMFSDLSYGVRAALVLLRRYINDYHLSRVMEIITRFAPPTENNTIKYINFVCDEMERHGFSDVISANDSSLYYLVKAMAKYESNTHLEISFIHHVDNKFK